MATTWTNGPSLDGDGTTPLPRVEAVGEVEALEDGAVDLAGVTEVVTEASEADLATVDLVEVTEVVTEALEVVGVVDEDSAIAMEGAEEALAAIDGEEEVAADLVETDVVVVDETEGNKTTFPSDRRHAKSGILGVY